MNAMLKQTLTLVGAVAIVGLMTGVAVAAIKKSRGPSGKPGQWVYNVAKDGFFADGSQRYAASIAPDQGENWAWDFVGRAFKSAEEAKAAAIAAITSKGGSPAEFIG